MYQSNQNNQFLTKQTIVVNDQTSIDNSAELMKILVLAKQAKSIKSN